MKIVIGMMRVSLIEKESLEEQLVGENSYIRTVFKLKVQNTTKKV